MGTVLDLEKAKISQYREGWRETHKQTHMLEPGAPHFETCGQWGGILPTLVSKWWWMGWGRKDLPKER